jgi:hypothetical protein
MSEQDRSSGKNSAPGGIITAYALKYARSFYEFAEKKFPELNRYPPDKARGTLLQAAIVVSTLIMVERRSGGAGWGELCDDVSRAFAPTVQRRHVSAIIDLSCHLLQVNRGSLDADAIPSFAGLASAPDEKLVGAIGAWLTLAMAKKRELEPSDLKVAAAIGRSAWTSAAMIVRMLHSKEKS